MKQMWICLLINTFNFSTTNSQAHVLITSPDHNIVFKFQLTDCAPFYSVEYKRKEINSKSGPGLQFEAYSIEDHLKIGKSVFKESSENYELVVGKAKNIKHPYKKVTVPLVTKDDSRKINFIVRMYNDGIGFCYAFPYQKNWQSYNFTAEEKTCFNLKGNPVENVLQLASFTTSHKGVYTTVA